ncbi:MAG: hypothetical protein AB1778_00750 [Candidatus Bipolaricaulota bacterium]
MDREGFRAYLKTRHATDDTIERSFGLAEAFERLTKTVVGRPAREATAACARSFVAALAGRGEATVDALLAVARYERFLGNRDAYLTLIETLDGHEVMGNLHQKVADEAGEALRDEAFSGVEIPEFDVSNLERARRMRVVAERLEILLGRNRAASIFGQGLRDLPNEAYVHERTLFEEAGGIDEYLRRKGDRFIAELREIRDQGSLYYTQPVTDEVIAYVEEHPEIRQGVRVGNVLVEAKIPYMAAAYLRESNAGRRAYLYCHCPWARESLQHDEKAVPRSFCNCSAAFHRKPYEVIFGRSLESRVLGTVLAGDPWCRFAITLPEGVA